RLRPRAALVEQDSRQEHGPKKTSGCRCWRRAAVSVADGSSCARVAPDGPTHTLGLSDRVAQRIGDDDAAVCRAARHIKPITEHFPVSRLNDAIAHLRSSGTTTWTISRRS